jgi:hypothetical protein
MYLIPDVRGFGSSVVNNSTTSNSIEVLSIGTAYLIFYLVPLLPTDRLATIPPPLAWQFFGLLGILALFSFGRPNCSSASLARALNSHHPMTTTLRVATSPKTAGRLDFNSGR